MAGVFKSLDRSDIRLTPFRVHKLISISGSVSASLFTYRANYNPVSNHPHPNPLIDSFDQGNTTFTAGELTTSNGHYQRVVHRSIDHLYYRDYYTNTRAAFGGGNINNQVRSLEDQAQVISIPQTKFGESLLQGSIRLSASYAVTASATQSLVLVDDIYGNLLISGSITSAYGVTISGSISHSLVGSWPGDEVYKYVTAGRVNFTGSTGRDAWRMQLRYTGVEAREMSSSVPVQVEDLLGACLHFTSSLNSRIQVTPSEELDFIQHYNFGNGNFSIACLVRPELQSTHPSGSIIVAKQGPSERLQIDLNGNLFTESVTLKTPYTITFSGSRFKFERDCLYQSAFVTSSTVSLNQFHHVVALKTGSTLQLWVNGALAGTAADVETSQDCSNYSDIFVGNSHDFSRGFNGVIDSVKVYRGGLASNDITLLRNTYNVGDLIMGNVFYTHGMIILTANPTRHMVINNVEARATQTIWETEVLCTVGPGEFGMSTNRSLQQYDPDINQFVYTPFITSSYFKPYVTTVGLYNDRNDLVAVAKLSTPIQLPNNVDTTFVIRFDKW